MRQKVFLNEISLSVMRRVAAYLTPLPVATQ